MLIGGVTVGPDEILGNETLKNRLSASLRDQRFSHSYLISGPAGSGKRTLTKLLCAAMECQRDGNVPCGVCPQCRKVLNDSHPDVIFVDDPEKKSVSVGLARWAAGDLYVRPNEGKKKIYVFPRAQALNPQAQNALLKVMEEPPAYGTFLLLSDRAEGLLPTVRSRCVELTMRPVPEETALPWLRQRFPQAEETALRAAWRRSSGWLGQAAAELENGQLTDERAERLCEAFAAGDRLLLTELLCKLERCKREQLIPILRQSQAFLADALAAKSGFPASSETARKLADSVAAARLLQAYRDLQETLEAADGNVGVGHICGYLAVRLR